MEIQTPDRRRSVEIELVKGNTMRVEGKVALITGAAGNLGAAISARLAGEGAKVVLADINLEIAQAEADKINAAGGTATAVTLDVRDEAAWTAAITHAESVHGPLTILVNNAGVLSHKPIEGVTAEDLKFIFEVNVNGPFFGVREGVKAMRAHGQSSSIVSVSSLGGMSGAPFMSVYNASKAAVRYMSKCVALECCQRKDAIRLNTIHPGLIMGDRPAFHQQGSEAAPPPEMPNVPSDDMFSAMIPMGRPGRPSEAADLVLFLASEESSYMTGGEFTIDGGWGAR
jgi:NAD(P)-dependent dehydrogenase (short-subunit alcohol dehydrogenase family)